MKLSYHMILCFGLATAFGCQHAAQTGHKSAGPSLLNGTERILVVDRSCKNPHRLTDEGNIHESSYTKDTQRTTFDIAFSSDGSAVKIMMGSNTVESVGMIDDGKVKKYGLRTFAGGHLFVWPTGAAYEAELTLYGSGPAVIMSVRGPLVEKESSNK